MDWKIVLNNAVYKPSETISGKVIVDFSEKGSILGIVCNILGKEETRWNATESLYDQRTSEYTQETVQYKGDNVLLILNQSIVTSEIFVEAGLHEFPFTFELPKQLPSTYKSNFGSIQYDLKVIFSRAPHIVSEKQVPIYIKAPIDFNEIKGFLQLEPIVYQNEEVIWHCCYAGDPITMDLILEREAYVLDEPIPLKLDVNNKSNEEISEINVTLTLVIEATATVPKLTRTYYEQLLRGAKLAGLGSGKRNLYGFKFELPPSTEVPNFKDSTLFRQKCVLAAEVRICNSETTLDVQTEIKLGNIPIERSRRITHPHGPVRRVNSSGAMNRPLGFMFFNSSTANMAPSAPPAETYLPAVSKTTDDIDNLPPSYEEAIRLTFPRHKKSD